MCNLYGEEFTFVCLSAKTIIDLALDHNNQISTGKIAFV